MYTRLKSITKVPGFPQHREFLKMIARKKYPRAMKLIDGAIQQEDAKQDQKDDTLMLSMLGMKAQLLHDMGHDDECLGLCDELLETYIGNGMVLYTSAEALCGMKRYHEALQRIDEALASKPVEPIWAAFRSEVLLGLGRIDDALAAADAALEMDPDDPYSQGKKAMVLMRMGKVDEAVSIARSNLARDRTHTEALEIIRMAKEQK